MPTRQYRDPSGTEWEVFEVHRLNERPNSVRPALAEGWLAFVSDREKRRLPSYPPGWMDLGDDELQELLAAAFVVADSTATSRPSGPVLLQAEGEVRPLVERRRRPRLTPQESAAIAPVEPPAPVSTITTAATTPATGGLPVPPSVTVTDKLGSAGIEELVRAHARQARQDGIAVIQGMIGVKRALADAGEDISPDTIALLRKVFVDEFYFAR